jgi:hypothetical protein
MKGERMRWILAVVMQGGLIACSAPRPPLAAKVETAPAVSTETPYAAAAEKGVMPAAIDTTAGQHPPLRAVPGTDPTAAPAPAATPTPAATPAAERPRAVSEPMPIAIGWAPPPLRIDVPPSPHDAGADWVAGFWNWNRGAWRWQDGEWAIAPQNGFHWVNPYYENRHGLVIFIPGYWSAPGLAFVPPIPGLRLAVERADGEGRRGTPPKGPDGVFIPAPPGSRAGVIVPAPIGTAPAVVTAAPPLANSGMSITADINTDLDVDEGRITMSEGTDVILHAPRSATLDHRAFEQAVPADAALAAALYPFADYGR